MSLIFKPNQETKIAYVAVYVCDKNMAFRLRAVLCLEAVLFANLDSRLFTQTRQIQLWEVIIFFPMTSSELFCDTLFLAVTKCRSVDTQCLLSMVAK